MVNIFAYTEPKPSNPAYVSLNKRNGKYYLSVRSSGEQGASEIELPFIEVLKLGSECHSILNFDGD